MEASRTNAVGSDTVVARAGTFPVRLNAIVSCSPGVSEPIVAE